jgi:hypothetical protein
LNQRPDPAAGALLILINTTRLSRFDKLELIAGAVRALPPLHFCILHSVPLPFALSSSIIFYYYYVNISLAANRTTVGTTHSGIDI